MNDAIWGTAGLVEVKVLSKKKAFPESSIVLDDRGEALKAWGLQTNNSAIIVVDEKGQLMFFKEGALLPTEQVALLKTIKRAIARLEVAQ